MHFHIKKYNYRKFRGNFFFKTKNCHAFFLLSRLDGDGIDFQAIFNRTQHTSFVKKLRLELAELDMID